jgi:hypothetical protein
MTNVPHHLGKTLHKWLIRMAKIPPWRSFVLRADESVAQSPASNRNARSIERVS